MILIKKKKKNNDDGNEDKNDDNNNDPNNNIDNFIQGDFNLLKSVKTKVIYNNDDEIANNYIDEDKVNERDEEQFCADKIDNDVFPGMSVADSIQISDELPFDIHDHSLSCESLKNEKCIICSNEKTCEKGYKCKLCPLKICEKCSNYIRINYYSHNKHEHSLTILNKENWKCSICKKTGNFKENFYFKCNKCNFGICIKCYYPDKKDDDEPIHEHSLE